MNLKKNYVGILSAVFWGLSTVVLAMALGVLNIDTSASTLSVTWVHDTFSAIILIVYLVISKKFTEFLKTLKSKNGLIIVGAALLGGPIGMGAYFIAINNLSPSIAASISTLYPAVGVILSYFILKEKISKRQVVGLLISIFAIMLMGISNQLDVNNLFLGILSISLCVIGWGSEAVIIGYALKDDVDTSIALTIRQFTSSIAYGVIILPILRFESLSSVLNNNHVMILILITAMLSTLSYLFYYSAISTLGAIRAMALNISYPVFAFIFEFILIGTFEFSGFLLVMLILVGVYVGMEKEV